MVIWKYELRIEDTQQIEMPYMSEILSVGNQIVKKFIGTVITNQFVWHVFERR